jgi:hypothetical protein
MHHAMVWGHKSDVHVNECIRPVQNGAEWTSESKYLQITVLQGETLLWSSCEQKQCRTFFWQQTHVVGNDAKTSFPQS